MKKQHILNWTVTIIFWVALIVISFFRNCKWDLVATIVAAVVGVAGITVLSVQIKMIEELKE